MDMAETEIAPLAIVEPRPLTGVRKTDQLRAMEDELYEEAASILRDAMRFADVEMAVPEGETLQVPKEWGREMSPERAKKALRIAASAWMSAKDAPVALKLAAQTVTGVIKARATEKQGPRQLNVTFVKMVGAPQQFPELEVDT